MQTFNETSWYEGELIKFIQPASGDANFNPPILDSKIGAGGSRFRTPKLSLPQGDYSLRILLDGIDTRSLRAEPNMAIKLVKDGSVIEVWQQSSDVLRQRIIVVKFTVSEENSAAEFELEIVLIHVKLSNIRSFDLRGLDLGNKFAGSRPINNKNGALIGSIIDRLRLTSSANRDDRGRIVAEPKKSGHIFFGPYATIDAGSYSLKIVFDKDSRFSSVAGSLSVDVLWGDEKVALGFVDPADLIDGAFFVAFEIPEVRTDRTIEIRLENDGTNAPVCSEVDLQRLAVSSASKVSRRHIGRPGNKMGELMPRLNAGDAGRRDEFGHIVSLSNKEGHVFFGPYIALDAGRYSVCIFIDHDAVVPAKAGLALEVAYDQAKLKEFPIDAASVHAGYFVAEFDIPPNCGMDDDLFEIRLHTKGRLAFQVASVDLRAVPANLG